MQSTALGDAFNSASISSIGLFHLTAEWTGLKLYSSSFSSWFDDRSSFFRIPTKSWVFKLVLDLFVEFFYKKYPHETIEFLIEQFKLFSEFDSSLSESDVKLTFFSCVVVNLLIIFLNKGGSRNCFRQRRGINSLCLLSISDWTHSKTSLSFTIYNRNSKQRTTKRPF